jgi:hypothetical protein
VKTEAGGRPPRDRLLNPVVPLADYDCLPVHGGPMGGCTFTPLWDHVPGQWVTLVPRPVRPTWTGLPDVPPTHGYRISDDGKRVEWRRIL